MSLFSSNQQYNQPPGNDGKCEDDELYVPCIGSGGPSYICDDADGHHTISGACNSVNSNTPPCGEHASYSCPSSQHKPKPTPTPTNDSQTEYCKARGSVCNENEDLQTCVENHGKSILDGCISNGGNITDCKLFESKDLLPFSKVDCDQNHNGGHIIPNGGHIIPNIEDNIPQSPGWTQSQSEELWKELSNDDSSITDKQKVCIVKNIQDKYSYDQLINLSTKDQTTFVSQVMSNCMHDSNWLGHYTREGSSTGLIIGLSIGGFVLLLIVLYFLFKKSKTKYSSDLYY